MSVALVEEGEEEEFVTKKGVREGGWKGGKGGKDHLRKR